MDKATGGRDGVIRGTITRVEPVSGKIRFAMKGSGHRSRYDVRRAWECPECHRREWTTGAVVNRRCDCLAKANPPRLTWMRLIEEKPKHKRSSFPPLDDPEPPAA